MKGKKTKHLLGVLCFSLTGLLSGCGDGANDAGGVQPFAASPTATHSTTEVSSTSSYSQNFTRLSTYKNVGGVLAQRVAPGPTEGSQRFYQTYIYDGNVFDLVAIDPDTGAMQAFPSPAPYQKGAWALAAGKDNNIYVGTLTAEPSKRAHLLRFDPKTSSFTDLGQPSSTETYIWELVVAPDGRIYGSTFPNAKLVRYTPQTGLLEDLGRVDPAEMYARHMALGDDGYLYIGVGFSKNKIVAYNLATGEHKAITDSRYEGGIAGPVAKHSDGKVYGTLGGAYFLLENGTATPVSTTSVPAPIQTNRFADGRVITVHLASEDRSIVVSDPKAGTSTEYPYTYEGKEINTFTLGMGPDRKLYGSGYIPGHMYSIHADTGALTKIGVLAYGEFYNFLQWGTKLLGAAYYGLQNAPLMIYDPSKPLTDLKAPSTADSNPIFVHYEGEFRDWRPQAMIHGPYSKVYLGSFAGYGKLGGPLVVWDPATNAVENFPNLITDQSLFSLTVAGNLIVGSTTVRGGGGSHPTQTQAKIFVWDPATKQKVFEATPDPSRSMSTIAALTTAPNGLVYGSADGVLVSFNPVTQEIKMTGTRVGTIANSMGVGPDGLLWGVNRNSVYAVEPATGTMLYDIPVPAPVTAGFAIDEKALYYAAGADSYRFNLPQVYHHTGSLRHNESAYQPDGRYYSSTKSGLHKAWLRGPAGANFDLYLQKWDRFYLRWRTVASATGTTASEQISYSGAVGTYRWKLRARSGSGQYDLWHERP